MTLINKAFAQQAKEEIIKHLRTQLEGKANSNTFNLKDSGITVTIRTTANPHTKLTKFEVYVFDRMVGSGEVKFDKKIQLEKSFVETLPDFIMTHLLGHIIDDSGTAEAIDNMLRGITSGIEVEHPFGMSIKFHSDDDHQVLMITKGKDVLYALEEAVNLNEGIGTDLFTPVEQLKYRINKVLAHYTIREDFGVEYDFGPGVQF